MTLADTIKDLVVNDYFTPNIRAEVILDALLTPCITAILASQMGAQVGLLTLLTKEMSIVEKEKSSPAAEDGKEDEEGSTDDRGTKIDYVVEDDRGLVYLVELKTTNGSISNKQIRRYTENCYGKTFGEALGDKLLHLVREKFPEEKFPGKGLPEKEFLEKESLETGVKRKDLAALQRERERKRDSCADKARDYLKASRRASTNKYIYTLGQILDRHAGDLETLWDAPLRLVYLTPEGKDVFPGKPRRKNRQEQQEAERQWAVQKQEWEHFHLGPAGPHSSVSLTKTEDTLRGLGGEYARMLADIIAAIY